MNRSNIRVLALILCLPACTGDPPDFDALWSETTSRVRTDKVTTTGVDGATVTHQRPHLRDAKDRYLQIRGINVSGSHKAPPTEEFPSLYPLPSDPVLREQCRTTVPMPDGCIPERDVSYIGRPFALDDADRWYGELAALGFNSVRLITNWESIQPFRPGTCDGREGYSDECYDLAYLEYYEALIEKAADHGIYVLVDMHQDIFSRYLMAYYNERPTYVDTDGETVAAPAGSLENFVLSLFPPYTDWVRGHGAPRWVVETCLPEKDLDSKHWGMFRGIGGLDLSVLAAITKIFNRLDPGGDIPPWIDQVLAAIPDEPFDVHETSDMLPLSPWIIAGGLSMDVDRCFAALFAGDRVFPNLRVDTDGRTRHLDDITGNTSDLPDVKTYLQDEYEGAYRQLAMRAAGKTNVIGYDVMNEPVGIFLMLTLAGAYVQSGTPDGLDEILFNMFAEEGQVFGTDENLGTELYAVVDGLNLLPPDTEPETLKRWGLADLDIGTALTMNFDFDAHYLQPFYEKIGAAIQDEDPDAIIWFEPSSSLRFVTGPSPFFDTPMTRLEGIEQQVFAPHWYPDIYPRPSILQEPRDFTPDEWLYRDFTETIEGLAHESPTFYGNIPVVFGEFGTYFNFGGIATSIAEGYEISAHIINSYYEAFEELGIGNMIWCFSAENDHEYGELWNHEDFSIIDPDGDARAWPAYVRTHARATSGKLLHQRFFSQYHFYDPVAGEPNPERRYELAMELHEASAPTEVFVPHRQYPDGFYVWLSDGRVHYDHLRQVLYWYPSNEAAGATHELQIEPVREHIESLGWSYFFGPDGHVLLGAADAVLGGGTGGAH